MFSAASVATSRGNLRLPVGGGLLVADLDEKQWRYWKISVTEEDAFISVPTGPLIMGSGTLLFCNCYS